MTDNDMTDAFLKKHAPGLDTHKLALELGSHAVLRVTTRNYA
jgi:hypothetical protein